MRAVGYFAATLVAAIVAGALPAGGELVGTLSAPIRFVVVPLPNITNIFYGRDVGYSIEQINLDSAIQEISATDARRKLAIG